MPNKKAFIAILMGVGLILMVGRPYMVPVESDQQQREVASVDVAASSEPELLVRVEQDMDFYRQLSTGDSFVLQLGADNADSFAEVLVTQISRNGVMASIMGSLSLPDKGSILITVGDKFMHIFLTSEKGIYEFSGRDFQGVVERTIDMRFENDTVVNSNQSVKLNDQPVRRVLELPVTVK
jgi:hypothetical protein